MPEDIRQMFDRLGGEPLPEFASSLRSVLLEDVTEAGPAAPATLPSKEDTLMTITQERPKIDQPAPGHRRALWFVATAAAAVVVIVAGVALTRDSDGGIAPSNDMPAPTELEARATVEDLLIQQIADDGKQMWATRLGSTFLLRLDRETGVVLEQFRLPRSATLDGLHVRDGKVHVPTIAGVVTVDSESKAISEPMGTSADRETWRVAFTDDGVWLYQRGLHDVVLEHWSLDFAELLATVELGAETSYGLAGVGEYVYFASAENGLQKYDSNGELVGTISGIGSSFEMSVAPDGTLWVPDYDAGVVYAVDTVSDTIVHEVAVSDIGVYRVFAANQSVWVTDYEHSTLSGIDPETGEVTVTQPIGESAEAVIVVDGEVWVSGAGWATSYGPA